MNKGKFVAFSKCTVNGKVRIELDGVDIKRVHENTFLGLSLMTDIIFMLCQRGES